MFNVIDLSQYADIIYAIHILISVFFILFNIKYNWISVYLTTSVAMLLQFPMLCLIKYDDLIQFESELILIIIYLIGLLALPIITIRSELLHRILIKNTNKQCFMNSCSHELYPVLNTIINELSAVPDATIDTDGIIRDNHTVYNMCIKHSCRKKDIVSSVHLLLNNGILKSINKDRFSLV